MWDLQASPPEFVMTCCLCCYAYSVLNQVSWACRSQASSVAIRNKKTVSNAPTGCLASIMSLRALGTWRLEQDTQSGWSLYVCYEGLPSCMPPYSPDRQCTVPLLQVYACTAHHKLQGRKGIVL